MNLNKKSPFDIVDSYPLSSLQQGMLFHCLDAEGHGVYVSQIFCTLDEDIDTAALGRAWQRIFERHAIFRTRFRWDGNQDPLQEIHRQVEIPFESADWRCLTPCDQEQQSVELLAYERRGFDLSLAPITRLKLIRCAEHQYKLLWTYHHILVDGRSTFIIMNELFEYYQAVRDGHDLVLPEPRPYRDYVDWLRTQDFTRYECYWRKALKGFHTPTELRLPSVVTQELEIDQRFAARDLALNLQIKSRAEAFAKAHGMTLNTLIQGATSLQWGRRYCFWRDKSLSALVDQKRGIHGWAVPQYTAHARAAEARSAAHGYSSESPRAASRAAGLRTDSAASRPQME